MTFEDSYRDEADAVRPSGSLVSYTLQAIQRSPQRRNRAWLLIPAIAAMLCLVLFTAFRENLTPHDSVASQGGSPASTDPFIPVSSVSSTDSACSVNGMALRLISSHVTGNRSYILFELAGEEARQDMEVTLRLSKPTSNQSKTITLTPAAFDLVEKRAVYLAVFDNAWADWGLIDQTDGILNGTYYTQLSSYLTLQEGDSLTLTIEGYRHQFSGSINWSPNWNTLTADWAQDPFIPQWSRFYDAEPLYRICDGFEIVGAGMSPEGAHIVTRYLYDPDDCRLSDAAAEQAINFRFASLALTQRTDSDRYEPVNVLNSSIIHHQRSDLHEAYCQVIYPLTADEMSAFGYWANVDWQYAPSPRDNWSLSFILGRNDAPVSVDVPIRPEDIYLEAGECTKNGDGELIIPIFIRGRGIDQQSIPALELPWLPALSTEGAGWSTASRDEPLDGTAPHATIKLVLEKKHTLADLGGSLTIGMSSVSIGNEYVQTLHKDVTLSDLPIMQQEQRTFIQAGYTWTKFVLPPGETIIDFDGMALSSVGCNKDGLLILQTRIEKGLPGDEYCFVHPVHPGAPDTVEDDRTLFPLNSTGWEDEKYYYTESLFDLPCTDLEGWLLYSSVQYIGQVIEGEWSLTIPTTSFKIIP